MQYSFFLFYATFTFQGDSSEIKVPKQLAIKKMGHQVCKRDVGES